MRVGVLQTLGLGDFLTALPAIRAIRRQYAQAELTWIGKSEYLTLIEPIFDSVCDLRELADPRPIPECDVAINLHGSGPQSHARLAGSRDIIGFYERSYSPHGPAWSGTTHMRKLWIELLAAYGIEGDSEDFFLTSSNSFNGFVVHVDARDRDRWWPLDRFEEVISRLGGEVLVIGERLGKSRSLSETNHLVANAALVIGVDSGVSHLAYAYQRPTVTLFGPAPARRWGPPDNSRHLVLGNRETFDEGKPFGPCSPHLLNVSVDDVLTAVEKNVIHH